MNALPQSSDRVSCTERVHVVDDDPAVVEVVARFLDLAGISVERHHSATQFLAALRPDEYGCAVIDMVLPDVERFSLLRELTRDYPGIQVIMMSGHGDIPNAVEALRHGAMDFLEKPLSRESLTSLVAHALEIAKVERVKARRAAEIRGRIEQLAPREVELLPKLCAGRSAKSIAEELGLSSKTVQVHRSRILSRMRVDTVVELTHLLRDIDWFDRA